jgi:hypothetical protein
MNILKLLEKLDMGDQSKFEKPTSRRESIAAFGDMGKKVAMASVPLILLNALPKKAMAGITAMAGADQVTDVLNFALTLEYLERNYYTMGISSGVVPANDLTVISQIKKHEVAHVTFLIDTIISLQGTPVTEPTFDFTANGAFSPFTKYADFLALAQAFEDTGVRAYKGQAGNVMSNDGVLNAALRIHSVEARHAAEVRRLRKQNGMDGDNKAWISGNSRGTMPAATQAVYNGEDNVMQGGLDATTITSVGTAAVQEAFDEPLSDTQVLDIAKLFIK